jgi:excisionase family DNA binding protein
MSTTNLNRETLTVIEAATMLGVSRGRMYASIRAGEVPAIRLGRRLVVSKHALDRVLNAPALDGDKSRFAQ